MTIPNGILTISAFVSAVLLPWPFAAFCAIVASFFEPLVPLAVGILMDSLYYTPHAGAVPWFSFYGLVASLIAVLVRRQLRASIIR